MIEKNYTYQFNQSHHKILDLLWSDQDLQLYDNQSTTFMSTIFTVIAGFILVFGAIVHRAIFKLLNRLPDRPINTLIYPTLVSFCIILNMRLLLALKTTLIRKTCPFWAYL